MKKTKRLIKKENRDLQFLLEATYSEMDRLEKEVNEKKETKASWIRFWKKK